MFPVVAPVTTTSSAPPSLVATSLPENFAQHVPATHVSPSVSSVQISNNARGNGSYAAVTQVASYAVPVVEGDPALGVAGSVATAKIPAEFLAQIIGQGVPPALQGALSNVLASYDQLVANSFIKYKPSNATIPPPPPAGVFGKILAQERATPEPVRVEAQPVRVEQPQPVRVEAPQAPQIPVEQIARVAAPEIRQATQVERPAPQQPTPRRASTSSAQVAIKYLMSEARVDLEAPPAVKATA